jgi:hypothetical protein
MDMPFTTYCCVIPPNPGGLGRVPVAHMAWAAGPGLALIPSGSIHYVQNPQAMPDAALRSRCLMVLNDQPYDRSKGDPRRLVRECLSVCRSLGFTGMVCDFEQPVRPLLEAFVRECAGEFAARGLTLYTPERYAHCHSKAKILIPTALTSGSLPNRLRGAANLYGCDRVALEIERSGRDLILPSAGGAGTYLSNEMISMILASRGGVSFFSSELGARYFTYRDEENRTHFVVYDDPGTFRYKIELALQLGIREGFALYPDMLGLGLI